MKNIILLIVIILIGFGSTIFSQPKFRRALFMHHSVGGIIYDNTGNGATTSVPQEAILYNIAHSYTGTDSVYMDAIEFPAVNSGNAWYEWRAVFDGTDPDDNIYQYIDGTDYDIIIIKNCFTDGMAAYWYNGPADTLYPPEQTYYNQQWHIRYVISEMAKHPDKFFVIWTPLMYTPANSSPGGYLFGDQLAKWETDTLSQGLDAVYNSRYGIYPPNVYIYDYFHDIDSLLYLPLSLASAPNDNHPNEHGSELVAPLFVNAVFDAAIAYESIIPVELTMFNGSYEDGVINLKWITATETNNFGFEVERRNDFTSYESIGFVNGNGTSANRITYNFVDDNLSSNRYYYRLKQIDLDGTFEYSNEVEIKIDALSDFQLYQNYPNPFNPSTEIYYSLAKSGNVTLKVYNSLGSEVAILVDSFMNSGKHSVKFNAKNFTSGVYYYRIKTDNFTSTRKMLLIK